MTKIKRLRKKKTAQTLLSLLKLGGMREGVAGRRRSPEKSGHREKDYKCFRFILNTAAKYKKLKNKKTRNTLPNAH